MPIYHNDGLDDPLNFDGSNAFTGCASSPAPDAIDKPLSSDMLNMTVDRVGNAVTRGGVKHQGRPYQGLVSRAFTFFDCQGNPQLIAVAGGAFRFKSNQKLPEWGQMIYPPGGAIEAPYYPAKVFGTGPETEPPPPPPPDDEIVCGFVPTTSVTIYPPKNYYGFLDKPPGYRWGHACLRRFTFCYNNGPDHVRSTSSIFALNSSMNPIGADLLDHYLLTDPTFAEQLLEIADSIFSPLPENFYLQVSVEFDRPQDKETNALFGTVLNSRWRILFVTMKY